MTQNTDSAWVLVPREPTPEMLDATGFTPIWKRFFAGIYKQMLSAAPTTAEPSEEERLREMLADADKALTRLNRAATDQRYMLAAVVEMLGPKGREVWKMWQEQGVMRAHSSWGPDAVNLTGEEIAQVHLDVEAAPKTLIEDVDDELGLRDTSGRVEKEVG